MAEKARTLRPIGGQPGRTRDVVECPCGHVNRFYVWSWAGHGKARCKGCGGWIDYRTLEVSDGPARRPGA